MQAEAVQPALGPQALPELPALLEPRKQALALAQRPPEAALRQAGPVHWLQTLQPPR
jgi:hypothetical protein